MTTKAEVRAAYQAGLHLIPRHMHEGVTAHVEHGREVGGFLTALLEGDLVGAHDRADQMNRAHQQEWIAFLEDHLPAECHGTPLKAKAWRKMGGLDGLPGADGP